MSERQTLTEGSGPALGISALGAVDVGGSSGPLSLETERGPAAAHKAACAEAPHRVVAAASAPQCTPPPKRTKRPLLAWRSTGRLRMRVEQKEGVVWVGDVGHHSRHHPGPLRPRGSTIDRHTINSTPAPTPPEPLHACARHHQRPRPALFRPFPHLPHRSSSSSGGASIGETRPLCMAAVAWSVWNEGRGCVAQSLWGKHAPWRGVSVVCAPRPPSIEVSLHFTDSDTLRRFKRRACA